MLGFKRLFIPQHRITVRRCDGTTSMKDFLVGEMAEWYAGRLRATGYDVSQSWGDVASLNFTARERGCGGPQ